MRFMPMSDSELTLDLFYAPDPSAAYGHLQLHAAPNRTHRLVTRLTVQKRRE